MFAYDAFIQDRGHVITSVQRLIRVNFNISHMNLYIIVQLRRHHSRGRNVYCQQDETTAHDVQEFMQVSGLRYFPCASNLTFWGYPMAPQITKFENLRLFLVWTSQITRVGHSPTPNTGRIEEGDKGRSG